MFTVHARHVLFARASVDKADSGVGQDSALEPSHSLNALWSRPPRKLCLLSSHQLMHHDGPHAEIVHQINQSMGLVLTVKVAGRWKAGEQDILAAVDMEGPVLLAAASLADHGARSYPQPLR